MFLEDTAEEEKRKTEEGQRKRKGEGGDETRGKENGRTGR